MDIKHIWSGGKLHKPLLTLKCGKLTMYYQNGTMRYISCGSSEILRMVYPALRDRHWLNINPSITGESIVRGKDSFRIEYTAIYKSCEVHFEARYIIEGKPDNTFIFSFEGEAMSNFEKNRLGFCVLHPLKECIGKNCELTHSDGSKSISVFPSDISPEQPFMDLVSMKWKTEDSECTLFFEGDIFETEDQRNWTDASFKTYCTPLSNPFPVQVKKGERIKQKIELTVRELQNLSVKPEHGCIKITADTSLSSTIPSIGFCRSTRPDPLTEEEAELIRQLSPDHYRCEIYLFEPDWKIIAGKAIEEAVKLNCSIEAALFSGESYKAEITDFISWAEKEKPDISSVLLFHKTVSSTPDFIVSFAEPLIRKAMPDTRIGCGTNANFAELNRERPLMKMCDFLTFSVHPQEHASDNLTLVENLESQKYTVRTAGKFAEGKDIHISPVTLQRRFNANIENFETFSESNSMPVQTDTRLMSLFGACWATCSIKYLGEEGAAAITYFETAGERGIIQGSYDSRWPDEFKSTKGMIFPVYHIFRWILSDKNFKIIKSQSSLPLFTDSVVLLKDKQIRLALVNFGHQNRNVSLVLPTKGLKACYLDTETFTAASSDSSWIDHAIRTEVTNPENIQLSPYSVTFMEGELT